MGENNMSQVLSALTQNGGLIFPYVLGFTALFLAFLFRDSAMVRHHGFKIIALALLLPTALFASNKGWHDAFALVSGIAGYIFGSEKAQSASEQNSRPLNPDAST
jgi:hypothetical protein